MAKIKFLILSLFVFGAFNVQADYTEMYPALPKNMTGDLNFNIYCNDNVTINKIYQRFTNSTAGTVFDLITPLQTSRATTTTTNGVLEFNFTNLKCTASTTISATLDLVSGDAVWNWFRLPYAPYGTTPPYTSMILYADASEANFWLAQGYDFSFTHVETITSGGGGGANIYVGDTISGMVSEWECTTSGDTTNCAAIATSSIGMYNGPNFQEWLFVGGVIIFLLSFMFWGRISFNKPE